MNKVDILGVKIDKVSLDEASNLVWGWVKAKSKKYIVTPNIEFIIAAQQDSKFKKILNLADLSIPDSARLGWSEGLIREKNPVKKALIWLLFPVAKIVYPDFPVTTGTDLMEKLISQSVDKAATIGLLGGKEGVALKLSECLKEKYPGVRISFIGTGGVIDESGTEIERVGSIEYKHSLRLRLRVESKKNETKPSSLYTLYPIPHTDILFVAFGHIKQEKWIYNNLKKVDAKVFIGVGGAFDYLSGEVVRAPIILRRLGFEWLFRLIVQPWRIKRFGALFKFLLLVYKAS